LKRGEEFYLLYSYAASSLANLACNHTSHSDVDMSSDNSLFYFPCTIVPSYPRVMRSKTCSCYMKLRIITNAIYTYNVLLVCYRIDAMHVGLKETPFCPMICTKLKEPCFLSKFQMAPIFSLLINSGSKKKEPSYISVC
jgi:hypothetical protein